MGRFTHLKKANPTGSDFADEYLTNVAIAYMQDASRYIHHRFFPRLGVDKLSGLFPFFYKGDWTRKQAKKRAAGTTSTPGSWRTKDEDYHIGAWAIHKALDLVTKNLYPGKATGQTMEEAATAFTTSQALLAAEIEFAEAVFATGKWATDLSGAVCGYFDNNAINPIEIIDTACLAVARATGYRPNVAIAAPDVMKAIRHNTMARDYYKAVAGGVLTNEQIAAACGLEEIFVPDGVVNSEVENADATKVSMSFTYANGLLLAYCERNTPSPLMPSAGYSLFWEGVPGGSEGVVTEKWWNQDRKVDIVETEIWEEPQIVCTDLGYFLHTLLTP